MGEWDIVGDPKEVGEWDIVGGPSEEHSIVPPPMAYSHETSDDTQFTGFKPVKEYLKGALESIPAMATGSVKFVLGTVATGANAAINMLTGTDKPLETAIKQADEMFWSYTPSTKEGQEVTTDLTWGIVALDAPWMLPLMGMSETLDTETAQKHLTPEQISGAKIILNSLMLGGASAAKALKDYANKPTPNKFNRYKAGESYYSAQSAIEGNKASQITISKKLSSDLGIPEDKVYQHFADHSPETKAKIQEKHVNSIIDKISKEENSDVSIKEPELPEDPITKHLRDVFKPRGMSELEWEATLTGETYDQLIDRKIKNGIAVRASEIRQGKAIGEVPELGPLTEEALRPEPIGDPVIDTYSKKISDVSDEIGNAMKEASSEYSRNKSPEVISMEKELEGIAKILDDSNIEESSNLKKRQKELTEALRFLENSYIEAKINHLYKIRENLSEQLSMHRKAKGIKEKPSENPTHEKPAVKTEAAQIAEELHDGSDNPTGGLEEHRIREFIRKRQSETNEIKRLQSLTDDALLKEKADLEAVQKKREDALNNPYDLKVAQLANQAGQTITEFAKNVESRYRKGNARMDLIETELESRAKTWEATFTHDPKMQASGAAVLSLAGGISGNNQSPSDPIKKKPAQTGNSQSSSWISSLYGNSKGLASHLLGAPEQSITKKIMGIFNGFKQELNIEMTRKAKEFNKKHTPARQVAMTNYLSAGGDVATINRWASATKDSATKKGYLDALTLTPEEIQAVQEAKAHFDSIWEEANKAGILDNYVENYVRQEWEKEKSVKKRMFDYENMMKINPSEAQKRVFQNYFEGEQSGMKAKDKRIGYQMIAAEQSFKEAIAARKAVKDLTQARIEGKPVLGVYSGVPVKDVTMATHPELFDESSNPKLVRNTIDLDMNGYKYINHPSLKGLQWVQEINGQKVLMQGDAWVHPKEHGTMKAYMGVSWLRQYMIPEEIPLIGGTQPFKFALKVSGAEKRLTLMGPFHFSHITQHAATHKVNPLEAARTEIDFNKRPTLRLGVENGLMLSSRDGLMEFSEGISSGGFYKDAPVGTGNAFQNFSEYTFQEYIPRLKASMFERAFEENMHTYAKEIASGKLTKSQIAEITARQTNAAFGEMNYEYMGRDKTLQDTLRLLLLAPDFLEARVKMVSQALKPYGREQQKALARSAIGYAALAQVTNMMFAKLTGEEYNAKERLKRPFTIKYKDREYTPRTVLVDALHAKHDFSGFISARVNPIYVKTPYEIVNSKDSLGRKLSGPEMAEDISKRLTVPIPAQEFFKDDWEKYDAKDKILFSILGAIGVTGKAYKSDALEFLYEKATSSNAPPETRQKNELKKKASQIYSKNPEEGDAYMKNLVDSHQLEPKDMEAYDRVKGKSDLVRSLDRASIDSAVEAFTYMLLNEKIEALPIIVKKLDGQEDKVHKETMAKWKNIITKEINLLSEEDQKKVLSTIEGQ